MIDLKKLEENLKTLFEQETEESFSEWLIDKMERESCNEDFSEENLILHESR